MSGNCAACGCMASAPAHALVAALSADDVDAAIEGGLLDTAGCPSCAPDCTSRLLAARDERRFALAARERFRARQRRLATRAAEREAARRVKPSAANAPALPSAAAAVLQRALAKAAAKR